MIKVSVIYPHADGVRFDMDYYAAKHMPMVRERLGAALKGISIDRGIAGGAPGAPAPFLAMGHMLFDSVESFQAAFGAHAADLMADIPNYTDVRPVILVSEDQRVA